MATVVLLHRADGEGVSEAAVLAQGLERRLVAHLAFPLTVTAVSIEAGTPLADAFSGAAGVVVTAALEPLWSPRDAERYRAALTAAAVAGTDLALGWQDDERLLRAVVERCRGALGGSRLDDAAVLFLADPLPPIGAQDYHDAAQHVAARLVGMMAPGDWRLSFWASAPLAGGDAAAPDAPVTPAELDALLEWEWPTILVVQIGRLFSSEADAAIDERLAYVVGEAGRSYRRAPALGADPALQAALSDAVVDHLARRPLPPAAGGR